MMSGSRCGVSVGSTRPFRPLLAFVRDDGGYTTVAVAVALLVSFTLVFAVAAAEWTQARSGDVQVVADATAMAGANAVAAYTTVAQVLDACVLSMGLAGTLVYATGMVVAAIPFLQAAAPSVIGVGRHILDARRNFARSAAHGLARLERTLPALVVLNSASCVSANCTGGIEYLGCALPVPQGSGSDFSHVADEIDHEEMEARAEALREASAKREAALIRAREARERGWRADCVDAPLCMRTRAETLAHMSGTNNPNYASVEVWRFGYALMRARNYYAVRTHDEAPASSSTEELTRSAARRAFYAYAYNALSRATCVENTAHVEIDLPDLPHNKDETRATTLYTDALWPCTIEATGVTLHASVSCPGALGAAAGTASLADLENGVAHECPVCHMDLTAMGTVASASTNIDNGFEHYWRILVEASRDYQAAYNEAEEVAHEMEALANEGASAFQQALAVLAVDRPRLLPPGAWGCVSVVVRKGATVLPSELTSAFLTGAELPPGVAMAGATLAPDETTTETNNVLSRVLDGVRSEGSLVASLIGNVTELWGRLLVGYGSVVDAASDTADALFDGVGTLFGERVAAGLKGRLSDIVRTSGLQPGDLRLRKPVLVASQLILDKVGVSSIATARELVSGLPADVRELTAVNWAQVASELGYGSVTIAELPIPGTDLTIPLTIDLERLAGAS